MAYSQRTDLNTALPATAPGGQTYGARGAQESAQRAVPMARPPTSAPPPVDLTGPTASPGEPITTGLATGPGAGPEALPYRAGAFTPPAGSAADLRERLVGIYERFPNSGLRGLIAALDEQQGLTWR